MRRKIGQIRNRFIWLPILCGLLLLTGCGMQHGSTQSSAYRVSIMLPTFQDGQLPDAASPVIQGLEEYTNADVELIWVPHSTYTDKLKITLSSLKLPTIMVILSKSPEFINAVRNDVFWELGPYLEEYPNLRHANETVLRNAFIDGKLYGIPRSRDLGRYGVTIRKDWLENVGLEQPTTIEEFYEVLKAFTYNDPDQDGRDNTYGLVATSHSSTFDIIQSWFGVPNQWGIDEEGRLVPAHLTKEYKDALQFLKRLYDEGLMNPDFAVKDPKFWREALVHGKAGVIVDVADQAQRVAHEIEKIYGLTDVIDVFSGVEGPKGLRLPSTSGYEGMMAVSKSSVKTEAELRYILGFIDKLNDEEMQILLHNGIQGRHFQKTPEFMETDLRHEFTNLSQMLMFIPEPRNLILTETPIRSKVQDIISANESILINNPAEELNLDTYMKAGPLLDVLISDARTQYIIGQIDEAGWEEAIQQWRDNGGDDCIREINEQLQRIHAN